MHGRKPQSLRAVIASAFLLALGTAFARAQTAGAGEGEKKSWLDTYLGMVEKTQGDQPHWISPLFTTTARLNQRLRYDTIWQARPSSVDFANYGSGKGLELQALDRVTVTLGIPGYIVRDSPRGTQRGWADDTFQAKYGVLSANEESGNYALTGIFAVSVPTGSGAFTANKLIYTPTLAWGKGWGTRTRGFDIQSTLAVSIPSSDTEHIGVPVVWNTAFQGHVLEEHFWPEFEMNVTHWTDGPSDGKWQAIATIGFVAGRFPITGRLRLDFGVGYQFAVSAYRTYDHAWLSTLRLPF